MNEKSYPYVVVLSHGNSMTVSMVNSHLVGSDLHHELESMISDFESDQRCIVQEAYLYEFKDLIKK